MNRKLLIMIIFTLAGLLESRAQGYFSISPYDYNYGAGSNSIFGWGENFDRTIDTRPNTPAGYGVMMINYHTGLTFSAHSAYGGIRFYNQGYPHPYDPATGAVMVMSIVNGNVGIGTTSPTEKLHVNGNIRQEAGNEHRFYNAALNNWTSMDSPLLAGDVSPDFRIRTASGLFYIDRGGNVGIGTASPGGYQLAVNGNVHAKQVNVDINGWNDYVFNKDYILMPLKKIKIYIDQNHHLPEIPSEQQIIKNGLDVGEMNKVLVKKVEELTLYLIQQQEEIKKLKIKVEHLSKNKQ